jgi:trans-aconitate 2-methyltransferase
VTLARDWDGAAYDRLSAPMEAMGRAVLDRLPLAGDEVVIDAGCGSGRVTAALLDRVPRGCVIGVDGSPSMVAAAHERLGVASAEGCAHRPDGAVDPEPRVRLVVADLTELDLETHLGGAPVDAILSTATFHWIADHDLLFARLRSVLADGGRLVAQCGGEGNIDRVHAAARAVAATDPFAPYLADWAGPWNFAAPAVTEERLARAGFASARAWLEPRPVTPDDPHAYLEQINLGAHLEQLPAELHDAFVGAVVRGAAPGDGPLTIDYVRLNIDATA